MEYLKSLWILAVNLKSDPLLGATHQCAFKKPTERLTIYTYEKTQ